jgi:hypothetical protein
LSNGKLTGADMNSNRPLMVAKAERSRGKDLWGRVRSWGHPALDRPSRIPLRLSQQDALNGSKRATVRQRLHIPPGLGDQPVRY